MCIFFIINNNIKEQENFLMQFSPNPSNSQIVFSKDFISFNASPSTTANFLLERKLQKPQRSHMVLRNMLTDNNNFKEQDEESSLKRSITSQSKRSNQKQPTFSNILRTIHRRPIDGERSKTVGKGPRKKEDRQTKLDQLNHRLRQRRQVSLKNMLRNTLYQTPGNGSAHLVSSFHNSKSRTPTVPLKQKHKSSGNFSKFARNSKFYVTQSSEILLSNLLNPQPEQKQIRKDSSDSAKRFYLKLKKNKLGNLWKAQKQQPSLLDEESVSKQVPYELGICKIKLPKRNYRHQFLQNIQKIKENYLRIKGSAQRAQRRNIEHPSNCFQRSAFKTKRKDKKTYEIKYRRVGDELARSKTEFFQSRCQWQVLTNSPLQPWDTDENNKMLR